MVKKQKFLEETPAQRVFRAKRRWQIALRRYVTVKHYSAEYAPYFALDVNTLRAWFETQFDSGMSWENFGKAWQFDHIIPMAYFDFENEAELKLCWNFTNLRVEALPINTVAGNRVDVVGARRYFQELYQKTGYSPCLALLDKIDSIEGSQLISSAKQFEFITKHRDYLKMLESYSVFEFEMLNSGRSIDEVNKEIELLKKIKL